MTNLIDDSSWITMTDHNKINFLKKELEKLKDKVESERKGT